MNDNFEELEALFKLGKFDDLIDKLQRKISNGEVEAEYFNLLGKSFAKKGNLAEANKQFEKWVEAAPKEPRAHYNLGLLQSQLGKTENAVNSYQSAISLNENFPEALNNLGTLLQKIGRIEEAAACFVKAIEANPSFVAAVTNLGIVQKIAGEIDSAEANFRNAIRLDNQNLKAISGLGDILVLKYRLNEAKACFQQAITINPNYSAAHYNLGFVLEKEGHIKEAKSCHERSLELDASSPHGWNGLGKIHQAEGNISNACDCYLEALSKDPKYIPALKNYVNAIKIDSNSEIVEKARSLLADRTIDAESRALLEFAMHKIEDDLGNIEQSFTHLEAGNRLRRSLLNYSLDQDRIAFERITSTFESFLLPKLETDSPLDSPTPIFILGMPRSGSTLVEQIISTHDEVSGAGELDYLKPAISSSGWPDEKLSPSMLEAIRAKYLQSLSKHGDTRFITDKLPHNFRWIGFLVCALPECKIVHTVRDPRAVCWSNYKQAFDAVGLAYSYDLEDVAHYYNEYVDLMSFWRVKFPNSIYELDYDKLTEDPEQETRALLSYLDLEWDEGLLKYYETNRTIQTASNIQVRQKIYKGSSQNWKKYEQWLNPMLDILEF